MEHDEESYHAAWHRALALGEINEDGRDPETMTYHADSLGRRDMWRAASQENGKRGMSRRPCACGNGRDEYVGGNRATGLMSGCRQCVTEWVIRGSG